MLKIRLALCGAAVSCALCGPVLADPVQFYAAGFENGMPGGEWGANKVVTTAPHFGSFLGRYSEFDAVKLKLPVPEAVPQGAPVQYSVSFDLYCIDSWDGSEPEHGKDLFQVVVDGTQWFSETFANVHEVQTFREPDIGRSHLGFNPAWEDSVYLGIEVPFLVDDWREEFSISFRSRNLSAMDDESWGIDNVRVSYEVVPAPGAGAIGLALLGLRARRRS
jgi:hypothetical protein